MKFVLPDDHYKWDPKEGSWMQKEGDTWVRCHGQSGYACDAYKCRGCNCHSVHPCPHCTDHWIEDSALVEDIENFREV